MKPKNKFMSLSLAFSLMITIAMSTTPADAVEPYIGEIQIFAFNFQPRGWAKCDGQILPINQNQTLYSLLGTMYGGDGRTSFALPDLRGRVPIHSGNGITQGDKGGEETHVLTANELPSHTHTATLNAKGASGNATTPGTNVILASNARDDIYSTLAPDVDMSTASISMGGGSQEHENMSPFLVMNYSIALQGLFPPRN